MNILFLGLGRYRSIEEKSISLDLLRQFRDHGDDIYIVSSVEEVDNSPTVIEEEHSHMLRVFTGRIRNTNILVKGLNTILIEKRYVKAINKYFGKIHFDLVLYPTPPITFNKVVDYIKKRDNAKAYLLLKDIFPQNAVDIGMLSKSGLKGILYKYFRRQEKKLYSISDYIGCMSQANVDYVLKHNTEIDSKKVEVCPNSVEVVDKSVNTETRRKIREKYGIPQDKRVFVYGGNLGKPQGIPYLIECLKKCASEEDAYFLIVGSGTEYRLLDDYVKSAGQSNVKLMSRLPKEDYDSMVGACDVGMIFLDHRFTIPNFPSRLLSYMQAKLPVLACTDPNTDVGNVILDGGFGWWCESNNSDNFYRLLLSILKSDTHEMGLRGYDYLLNHYQVKDAYNTIVDKW